MNPLTLRQISGLPQEPAPLDRSVIIVVDAQKEYTEGKLPLSGIDESIKALARFLQRARRMGVPIIHVVQVGRPGGPICDPEGPYVEIIDAVKPQPGESIVEKRYPSSFTETSLGAKLDKLGRKDLIITGYMTHMCVNSTTRAATEMGYRCTVVSELTTTRDLPDGKGGIVPAQTVKTVHLAALADRFAVIVERSEDLT